MEFNLIISAIILVASWILVYKFRKNSNLSKATILLAGLFLALVIQVYPLYDNGESELQRLVFSILYTIQCIYVGQDFELIQTEMAAHQVSNFYYILVYLSFLLAPIFTTGIIITLIENTMHKLKYNISLLLPTKKEIHIFSNINRESVTLAESLYDKRNVIVFCNEKEEDIKESLKIRIRKISGITINQSELDVKVRNKKVVFYEISEDERQNTDKAIELINKYQDNQNIKVMVFSTHKEAEMLLDSVKRKMSVELVNKNKYALYNLLEQRPVIEWSKNNKISVLIIGDENKALDSIKTIFWSMQLDGYGLEINVVGNNAEHIKSMFYHQCPGLKEEKYKINFYKADIQTEEIDEVIKNYCSDTNYIILSLNDDNLNIETGIYLREYFLYLDKECYSNKPSINIWLNDEIHGIDRLGITDNNYAKTKEDNRKVLYELYSFGTIEQTFKEVSIFNNKRENLALLMHLANVGVLGKGKNEEVPTQTFRNREKTRKYSMASAIHMKYCLYTKGVDLFNEKLTQEHIEKVKELVSKDEEIDSFMRSYARMWNTFWRTDGYRRVSFEEASVYYKKGVTKTQQHTMARLNPCLTDLDGFAENEIKMSELYGRKVELLRVDRNYIKFFPTILQRLLQSQKKK
mgnify:FL=1